MPYTANAQRYDKMEFRRCGNSGLKLPAVSLGLWHNFGHIDVLENARNILRIAFDNGITHFDLANNYGPPPGSAEENFGLEEGSVVIPDEAWASPGVDRKILDYFLAGAQKADVFGPLDPLVAKLSPDDDDEAQVQACGHLSFVLLPH